jgi:hypothetical protein
VAPWSSVVGRGGIEPPTFRFSGLGNIRTSGRRRGRAAVDARYGPGKVVSVAVTLPSACLVTTDPRHSTRTTTTLVDALRVRRGPLVRVVPVLVDLLLTSADVRRRSRVGCSYGCSTAGVQGCTRRPAVTPTAWRVVLAALSQPESDRQRMPRNVPPQRAAGAYVDQIVRR